MGEWRRAEVLRVTRSVGRLYYVLRDATTNVVEQRVTPDEVQTIREYAEFESDLQGK